MDISSVNSDLIRGNVTTIILGCLFENDKYGYEILKEIEEKSTGQYELKQATLYNQLKRLEKQGLVSSYDGDPENTGGGQRRYYGLTPEGRIYLRRERREYEYSRTILDKLVSAKPFDFTKPLPFDASDLRPYTKREPGEKTQIVYKDKIVEVEKLVYVDLDGNRITEDEAKMLAAQTALDRQNTLLAENELAELKAQLLRNEETRQSYLEQISVLRERLNNGELSPEAQASVERLKDMLRESEQERLNLRVKLSEQAVKYDDIALRNDQTLAALNAQLLLNEELRASYLEQIAVMQGKLQNYVSPEVGKTLAELNSKLEQLQLENEELSSKLNEQTALAEQHERTLTALNSQILRNEELKSSYLEQIAALRGKLENYVSPAASRTMDELNAKLQDLQLENTALSSKLNEQNVLAEHNGQTVSALNSQLLRNEELRTSYLEQINALREKLDHHVPSAVKQTMEILNSKLEEVQLENAELLSKLNEQNELSARLERSENERQKLTEQLLHLMLNSDLEKQAHENKIKSLTEEIDRLNEAAHEADVAALAIAQSLVDERDKEKSEEYSQKEEALRKKQEELDNYAVALAHKEEELNRLKSELGTSPADAEELKEARRKQYLAEEQRMSVTEQLAHVKANPEVKIVTDNSELSEKLARSESERIGLTEKLLNQMLVSDAERLEMKQHIKVLEKEAKEREESNATLSAKARDEYNATLYYSRKQQYLAEERLLSVQEYFNTTSVKEKLASDPRAARRLDEEIKRSEAERLKLSEELVNMMRHENSDKIELMRKVEELESENALYKKQYNDLLESNKADEERKSSLDKLFDEFEARYDEKMNKRFQEQALAQAEKEEDEQPVQLQEAPSTAEYADSNAEEIVTLPPVENEENTRSSMRDLLRHLEEKGAEIDAAKQQQVEASEVASDVAPSAVLNRPESFAYENDNSDYRDFFFGLSEQKPEKPAHEQNEQQAYYSPDIKTRLYQQGFKLRPYERNNSTEYYSYNFILSNRINRDTFLIVLALFVAEVAVMWLSLSSRVTYKYFLPILLVGTVLCLIPTVMWLADPMKRKRANFNFKLSILNRTMLFIELSVVCVLIGFFALGASVNDIDLIICSIVLPSVILLNLPISSVIYYLLYSTKKYHIA